MTERHEVILAGCSPTPLASYLKGLGILSLIAAQIDRQATARWSSNTFVLRSILDRRNLRNFFLCSYIPTPIISPWSGRAGFLEGETGSGSTRKGAVIVNEIIDSKGNRFKSYRSTLNAVKNSNVVSGLNNARIEVKNEKEKQKNGQQITDEDKEKLKELERREKNLKNLLLLSLRADADERFLPWFDACMALAGNESLMAPLLGGSGGNEGSMDFSINHLEHLKQLIDPVTDLPTEASKVSIEHALFGKTTAVPSKVQGNPGFFSPGVTGGPNMSNGYFEKKPRHNPWNTVLMLEGAILFASTITKKSISIENKFLSFPFMFEAFQAGDGSIYAKEKNRPEFWAPLWKQFATITELRSLISEGRCTVSRQAVNHGLDMLRAVKSLGVDRNISAFQRYGFFKRRGDVYTATPIGRFSVEHNEVNSLIEDLYRNNWLSEFHRFTNGKTAANRFVSLRRKLDEQLFLITSRNSYQAGIQQGLSLLGEIQAELAHSAKARKNIPPIPQLSKEWVLAADDNSTVFRIARALAGLRGVDKTKPLPLRSQLFPIHHANRNQWLETACKDKIHKDDPSCRIRLHISHQRNLTALLIALLLQRMSLPSRLDFKDKPLNSTAGVDLADLSAFLTDEDDSTDSSISALLPGLSLCNMPYSDENQAGEGEIYAAYALCKLALTPDATLRRMGFLGEKQNLPVAPQLVSKLATGNTDQAREAIKIAWGRLRGSGLEPVLPLKQLPDLAGVGPRRLAAALLIPLNFGATGALARDVLKNDDSTETELS